MPYSQFTLQDIKKKLQLSIYSEASLFPHVQEIKISDYLTTTLANFVPLALAINTEKARSEWIIAPILAEFRQLLNHKISLFSGVELNVDPSQGLNGMCDYIISRSSEQYYVAAPVITIVEAKRENINEGLGQCAATMVGARIFNVREGNDVTTVYGAVTTGTNWKFLKLVGDVLNIDRDEYYLVNIGKIMGILTSMVDLET